MHRGSKRADDAGWADPNLDARLNMGGGHELRHRAYPHLADATGPLADGRRVKMHDEWGAAGITRLSPGRSMWAQGYRPVKGTAARMRPGRGLGRRPDHRYRAVPLAFPSIGSATVVRQRFFGIPATDPSGISAPNAARQSPRPAVSYGKARSSVSLAEMSMAARAFTRCSKNRCGPRSAAEGR